jgi:hypothetical protein
MTKDIYDDADASVCIAIFCDTYRLQHRSFCSSTHFFCSSLIKSFSMQKVALHEATLCCHQRSSCRSTSLHVRRVNNLTCINYFVTYSMLRDLHKICRSCKSLVKNPKRVWDKASSGSYMASFSGSVIVAIDVINCNLMRSRLCRTFASLHCPETRCE